MTERAQSEKLDRVLETELGVSLKGARVEVPTPPKLDLLPKRLIGLTGDPVEAGTLAVQVAEAKIGAIKKLKENKEAILRLDDPANVALLMTLGPCALGRVAVWNPDRSVTQMFASTTPETNLDRGRIQFTWIGLQDPNGKWSVPVELDPLRPELVGGNDLLTYLSGSNQLGVVGNHSANAQVRVEDPRHLINQFMRLEQPETGSHKADDLEDPSKNQGRRRLLAVTSAQTLVRPGEFGSSIFQDPVFTTKVYEFEEIPIAWVFAPELMDQEKLRSGEGDLETMRTNKPDGLQRLQRMGFASLMNRGLADNLSRILPQSGLV